MDKKQSAIVIDTPSSCSKCELRYSCKYYGHDFGHIKRHRKCPLKQLPSKEEAELCYNIIYDYLTPPTVDEVCKALSDYYKKEVVFKNKSFQFDNVKMYVYKGVFNAFKITINRDWEEHNNISVPIYLITYLGRFYEEDLKK